jgi:hypothetical protein
MSSNSYMPVDAEVTQKEEWVAPKISLMESADTAGDKRDWPSEVSRRPNKVEGELPHGPS